MDFSLGRSEVIHAPDMVSHAPWTVLMVENNCSNWGGENSKPG
jgi:hypothetical protein